MSIHRRGGKRIQKSNRTIQQKNTRQRGRLIEPLEDRTLFSQPPLTVQPPAAFVASAPDVTGPGAPTIAITVQYSDSTAFNFNSFNENNVTVSVPGGGTLTPAGFSLAISSTNDYPQVTYTFDAPGGAWAPSNDGVYAINTVSGVNAVTDTTPASPVAGEIGHFKVFTGGSQAGFSGAVTGNFTTSDVIQQADGAYVAVGQTTIAGSTTAMVLQRYGGSGGNDFLFGADGEDELQFGAASAGYGVVEQNDGQLVVVGTATDPSTSATDFAVFRIGGSGFPDPTFGQDLNGDGTPDGIETVDVGGSNPAAYAVTLQIDGGIIAVGTTNDTGNGDLAIARVNPNDGLLDAGFGTGGFTTTSFGSAPTAGGAVAIVPSNNDIIVAGNSGSSVILAEYTPAGVLDTTFGANGLFTVPGLSTNNQQVGLAIQPSGGILVSASDASTGDMAVERLTSAGAVDSAFGSSGIADLSAGGTGKATSIVLQPGGQIDVGGVISASGNSTSVLTTLTANGAAENNFSGADHANFGSVSGTPSESAAMTIAPGGVVFATSNSSAGTSSFTDHSTALVAPTASMTSTTVTTPAASASFTVTYADNVAIDPSTIATGNITVSDGAQSLTVTSATPSSNSPGTPITVTYTVAAPGGQFTSAANGAYTVALAANQVKNTGGTAVAANSSLGTVTIDQASAPLPAPSLSASNLTTNNSSSYSFTVTYTDALGINVATVAPSNVTVTGPNGALTVTSAVANPDSNGSPRTVTYTVAAPHSVFSTADNGSCTIGMSNTLQDVDGNPTAVNADLGTFTINVSNSPRTALGSFGTVTGSKKPVKLTVSVNGVPTTFAVTNGSGQAFLDGSNVDLTIAATSSKKVAVAVAPKGAITLGNVSITGNVSTFAAPKANLAGTFSITGGAGTVTLANLSNATFAVATTLTTFKAASMTNSNLLAGVQESGPSYGQGIINAVTISGTINSSVIAAGANPVNGVFGDGNDALAGAGSMIKSITAKGGTTGTTVFESGAFKTASLPKKIKTISADSRFKILSA